MVFPLDVLPDCLHAESVSRAAVVAYMILRFTSISFSNEMATG
jgi:hypothetical protein